MRILEKYSLGGILADDMGLGKSLEIICLLKSNVDNKPSLIVCPKSLIFNWVNEFNKFDEETKVVKIYGTTTQRKDIITSINPNEKVVNGIIKGINRCKGDCPCNNDAEELHCPCSNYRLNNKCCCKLYLKVS